MSVFLNKHIILFRVDTQRHMQAQTESRILITLGTHKHVYRLGKITLFCSIILLEITLGCTHVCEVGSCTVSDSDTPSHVGLKIQTWKFEITIWFFRLSVCLSGKNRAFYAYFTSCLSFSGISYFKGSSKLLFFKTRRNESDRLVVDLMIRCHGITLTHVSQYICNKDTRKWITNATI